MRAISVLKIAGWFVLNLALIMALAAQSGGKVGTKAPDFSLKDSRGKNYSLRDYSGKKALLVGFWATWAASCSGPGCCDNGPPPAQPNTSDKPDALLAHLRGLRQKYRTNKPEILVISLDQNREAVQTYFRLNEIHLPLLFDTDLKVAKSYGVTRLPTVFAIDKQGIIKQDLQGFNATHKDQCGSLERCLRGIAQ